MIERTLNQMRLQARLTASNVAYTKVGTVTNYDPNTYTVKVKLQPVDLEDESKSLTGWIPYAATWGDDQWGLFAPPQIGNQCSVHFLEGSYDAAFASSMFYYQNVRPLPVNSGEFWIVHKDGATIKLTNDGNVTISSTATINIDAPNVHIGNGTLKKLLTEAAKDVYNSHTHTVSGSSTSTPIQQMDNTDLTSNTEAS